MKKLLKQFFMLTGVCLLLTACPYASDVAIDSPTVKIDEKLIYPGKIRRNLSVPGKEIPRHFFC